MSKTIQGGVWPVAILLATLTVLAGCTDESASQSDDRAARVDQKKSAAKIPDASGRKRWIAVGQVTDEQGRGIEGVEVRAAAGIGTMFPTGKTTTDGQGHFELHFSPGGYSTVGSFPENTPFQGVIISPGKDGWYEANLHRHGYGVLAGTKENMTERIANGREVILPDQPHRLDFIMKPAARIEGQVVSPDGQPLKQFKLCLVTSPLPPGCGVLANLTSDDQGRFTAKSLPLQEYWFYPGHAGSGPRTENLKIDSAGLYEVKLVYDQKAKKLTAEVMK